MYGESLDWLQREIGDGGKAFDWRMMWEPSDNSEIGNIA